MLRFLFVFSFAFFSFFPSIPSAGIGFVPSTKIWFSPSEFSAGDMIRLYTVVINNDYPSLSGTVGFYANEEEINRVTFQNLEREDAEQLRVFWQPVTGAYTLRARFLRAIATDENGVEHELDIASINSVDTAFVSSGGASSSSVALEGTSQTSQPQASSGGGSGAYTDIMIEKKVEGLLVVAPKETMSKEADTADSFENTVDRVGAAIQFVTSSANAVASAYEKTKETVETGEKYYDAGRQWWEKSKPYIQPYASSTKALWQKVSNNNDPGRVFKIAGGLLLLYILFRIIRRQRTFDDY